MPRLKNPHKDRPIHTLHQPPLRPIHRSTPRDSDHVVSSYRVPVRTQLTPRASAN